MADIPEKTTALSKVADVMPGLTACAAVAASAAALQAVEVAWFGRAWLEALVLAILLGAVVRTVWTPPPSLRPGVRFAAKPLLEVAIALLGASFGFGAILDAGPFLVPGIAGVVVAALVASYAIGRTVGLSHRLALLVACGNSICGNSAIVAAAPAVRADGEEVALSIAFTAALGVPVVLGLPLLVEPLGLSQTQYGMLAGLTVYAVPQVLAATVPVGALSAQVGTLVKLVRVLMLGPVVFALSVAERGNRRGRLRVCEMVPWFILGFFGLGALRSLDVMPEALTAFLASVASLLTLLSMAALGLEVDLRMMGRSGGRVTVAALLSLIALAAASLGLIRLSGIG
ncbi:YeiH family protein [Azospirillum soli]|uniref:YeiH family protein n=1 Tax=Azospirillum soli TaxID=1304799 RepID=UPI001AE94D13|nr:putative sulfate exporter family transporter [Azospirillum soli]MBP2316383.1 putative integral membrane protein (TIGR00698 family) [Azospirillum soli]